MMTLKILAFIIVLSLIPVFEIMANPDKSFITFQHIDGYVEFDLHPESNHDQYTPLDVGILVFSEGLLGIIPRTNARGQLEFPLFHNLISLASESTSLIIDPIFTFLSDYVPFWNYQPKDTPVHFTYDYTQHGEWNVYENRGGLDQTWLITNDPYLKSWWHPNHYIIYVVEENLYYKGIYLFGFPTVMNNQPFDQDTLEQLLEDLGYYQPTTGGDYGYALHQHP